MGGYYVPIVPGKTTLPSDAVYTETDDVTCEWSVHWLAFAAPALHVTTACNSRRAVAAPPPTPADVYTPQRPEYTVKRGILEPPNIADNQIGGATG